jgi:ABC-type lipoprotein export system ATPase subunit
MTNQYENVVKAYQKTFQWALGESTPTQLSWSNLSHWLKEGDGVYWINGKAGSGKSTLMKHIVDDPRTCSYLDSWAKISVEQNTKPKPLFVATYFF